ncbi:hypothetical protein ACFFHM_22620 [Halalkalibacter kiskunsagensis]|uniref:DUF4252 domain-containing protein n=1 Tax=Halalkalibacter kiskunsagensis TaxID=1548599 RepID=A0ABV6KIP3_9BACI
MTMKVWQVGTALYLLLLVTGCTVTNEEALELGYQAFKTGVEKEQQDSNTELTMLELYLPRGFEVLEELDYNVQIQSRDQLFLLFHSPTELPTSNIHLQRDMEYAGGALLYELIESNKQLAYLIVSEEEDGRLFVITTIGGAKLSTLTTYKDLEDNIGAMTEIVHSYRPK